jgi:hypothetical protein
VLEGHLAVGRGHVDEDGAEARPTHHRGDGEEVVVRQEHFGRGVFARDATEQGVETRAGVREEGDVADGEGRAELGAEGRAGGGVVGEEGGLDQPAEK